MTAYELRISDWSSDVCSSDLAVISGFGPIPVHGLIRVMLLRGRMRQAGHLSQGVREVIQEAVSHWVLQALRGIVLSRRFGCGYHHSLAVFAAAGQAHQIGRAHVFTPVTTPHLVCRRVLEVIAGHAFA